MKKLIYVGLFALLLSLSVVMAKPAGNGQGYDEWGYNYQANLFNGKYCLFDRDATTYCEDYPNDMLVMKWSDAWMTTKCGPDPTTGKEVQRGCDKDCNCDGTSKGWVTNHIKWYDEDGKQYNYFTKIVYLPGEECPDGYSIWGSYCVLQEVENGLLGNYLIPGLGLWT